MTRVWLISCFIGQVYEYLAEKDAQTFFEQGVRPPKPINRAIIHEEKYEFGKSTIGFNQPEKTEPSDK